MEDYFRTAHNSFLLAAVETGLIGLFFWIGLVYFAFKGLSLVQKNDISLKPYALGLQAGLIGFLVAAFFLSRTYITLPYIIFALSAALFNITKEKLVVLENRFTFQDIRNIGLVSMGVLVLTYGIMKVYI
jgi:O-antigen ligase